ncbi:SAF domain-containing protein [Thiomonas sp.]|jgi:N-acetylneuraminate synthase|uniref:SAF domain-containing protein n=1 Tax=Thiomonas sp. TaxID=2047785 RepID=UPI00345D79E6
MRVAPETVRSIRPGYGPAPKFLPQVLGRELRRDVVAGMPVTWSDLRTAAAR